MKKLGERRGGAGVTEERAVFGEGLTDGRRGGAGVTEERAAFGEGLTDRQTSADGECGPFEEEERTHFPS